jgi:hypothetical protein
MAVHTLGRVVLIATAEIPAERTHLTDPRRRRQVRSADVRRVCPEGWPPRIGGTIAIEGANAWKREVVSKDGSAAFHGHVQDAASAPDRGVGIRIPEQVPI